MIITRFFSLLLSEMCACAFLTFSPDTTHRDSVSMHLEFLKHLSSCLFNFTDNSDCLERSTGKSQAIYTLRTDSWNKRSGRMGRNEHNLLPFFPHLPCSNVGEAMGDSSMLKNMIPSFGRLSLGATSSHETWAMTLMSAVH